MENFDFSAPADVYTMVRRGSKRGPAKYRRFERGSEALQYVAESLPQADHTGLTVETDEGRFDAAAVMALYEGPGYPLKRVRVVAP